MILSSCNTEILDPNWVTLRENGEIEIIETASSGAGRVTFTSALPFIHLRHLDDQPPLKWTKNRRCADAAIIVEDGEDLCLHIVELKSKLTTKGWLIVKEQISGMIANATAMLAVINGPRPKRIVCHVSFVEDAVGSPATADLVFLKTILGTRQKIGATQDWHSATLQFPGHEGAPLRKIQRDPATGVGTGDLTCAA